MSIPVKKSKRSQSLVTTFALAFLALSVAVLLIASTVEVVLNLQTQQKAIGSEQQRIAQEAGNTVASFIQEKYSVLETAGKLNNLGSVSPVMRKTNLESLLGLDGTFRQVALLDPQGQTLVNVSRISQEAADEFVDRIDEELLSEVKQGNRYISPIYIDQLSSEPIVIIAVPVEDVFGDFQGTLLAEVNLKFMWELVDRLDIGTTGQAYVVDRQGDLIALGDIARVLKGENVAQLREVAEFINSTASVDETGAGIARGINDTYIVGTYVPLGIPDWAVVTELPIREAYQEVAQGLLISGGLIVVMALVAGVAGVVVARRLVVPLRKLTETSSQIAGGEFDLEAPIEGPSEIAQLAGAFNSMTARLRQFIGSLEDQIQERTGELALSMEVGQRAASIRDLDVLLPTVTEFIWDQFGLYYAQVFLVDDVEKNLVLRSGAGWVGQQMMMQGRTVSLDEYRSVVERTRVSLSHGSLSRVPDAYYTSIIGYVAVEGTSVVVSDTAESKFYKPDPLLPETRSELAIPLRVEGRVIGVLDMQDNKVGTFTSENVTVFEAMAVQLAISIDSARQWALAQEAQERAEKALQQLTREAWADRLVSSWGEEGFIYDLSDVKPLSGAAWAADKNISVPLLVQDQAIGQLNVNAAERDLTNDEQALLQAVAQQLAQKAENLRLFETTQQQASREQIARQIIDKIRASRNIETALQIATEELNKALGTARAVVDLQVPQTDLVPSAASGENIGPAGNQPANGRSKEQQPVGEELSESTDHVISNDGNDDELPK